MADFFNIEVSEDQAADENGYCEKRSDEAIQALAKAWIATALRASR